MEEDILKISISPIIECHTLCDDQIPIRSSGSIDDDDEKSVHAKIGPVCLFIGNLKEGTTVEEVTEVVEPFGDLKKVDVKVGLCDKNYVIVKTSWQKTRSSWPIMRRVDHQMFA